MYHKRGEHIDSYQDSEMWVRGEAKRKTSSFFRTVFSIAPFSEVPCSGSLKKALGWVELLASKGSSIFYKGSVWDSVGKREWMDC